MKKGIKMKMILKIRHHKPNYSVFNLVGRMSRSWGSEDFYSCNGCNGCNGPRFYWWSQRGRWNINDR